MKRLAGILQICLPSTLIRLLIYRMHQIGENIRVNQNGPSGVRIASKGKKDREGKRGRVAFGHVVPNAVEGNTFAKIYVHLLVFERENKNATTHRAIASHNR
jgi:hypothetical protein